MTEAMLVDAVTKLGSAGILGILLYQVLMRVGGAVVAGQDRVAAAVLKMADRMSEMQGEVTAKIERIEAKVDHQLAIDRDRERRATPPPVPRAILRGDG